MKQLTPTKKLILFFTLFIAFLLIGVSIGFILVGPSLEPGNTGGTRVGTQFPTDRRRITLSGQVEKMIVPLIEAEEATHRLIDEEGEPIALLQSTEIDLTFLEIGEALEVEGMQIRMLDNELMLVRVDEVHFR